MINILFCGNSGVFDGMLTASLSMAKRSKTNTPFNIYIFTMDVSHIDPKYTVISDRHVAFLQRVMKEYNPENRVTKIDVTKLYGQYFTGCPNESAYCSPYTLIRLFADLVPNLPDKLLYLDCDILFNKDPSLLYDIDVSDYEYAAARDHYGRFLINPGYINAGVLLLNLSRIKESGLFEKARALIQKKKLVFADQSAIIRSTTKRLLISQRFNDQKLLHKNTVIRHFSKRLFYLPYPRIENLKQWQVSRIHKVFSYYCFDDVLYEYIYLIKKFQKEESTVE